MKIDIRQIKPEGSEFHFSESAEELEISTVGVKFPSAIETDLTATLTGDEIIFQGEAYTEVEIECSRCLENFDLPIEARLQFVVQMIDSAQELSSEDEDFEVIPKTQTTLDISQRVREGILLTLPLKPLCSEDCKGLCPMCGINLNENDCDCMPDKTDERWDALKKLFDNQ
jgi:uncharacterized protein